MKPVKLFLFAGETSGDLHGGELLQALRKQLPGVRFFGVGGPKMRAQGFESLLQMEDFQVMGFTDVMRALPKLWKQFHQVRDSILKEEPEAVILIDYPGFNLRLAKALRKKGYTNKIIQYISPSVWAHGKGRIEQMAATLDLLLIIYPFEAKCFAETSLRVSYVGNPLVEILDRHTYDNAWRSTLSIPEKKPLIALFSGSRQSEIRLNLPKILGACEIYKQQNPELLFGLSVAHDGLLASIEKLLNKSSLQVDRDIFLVPKKFRYELMRDCRTAIAKSGTVTLELALHQKPAVVVYQVNLVNRLVAKYILGLKLDYYCIVNILLGKEVYPELIEEGYTEVSLERHLRTLDSDGELRAACIAQCKEVAQLLQHVHPSEQAAAAISALLQERSI
jgi:lipid-A-disaccharide synthase